MTVFARTAATILLLSTADIVHGARPEPDLDRFRVGTSAAADGVGGRRARRSVAAGQGGLQPVAVPDAGVHEPRRDDYVGAAQVYAWEEGAAYRLYAAPGIVSDIVLQAGEQLVSVAAGDTARWVIGDTSSGTGPARRIHVLLKPSAAGLRTNLVIATDRRVYHVEVASNVRVAMAAISWSYPDDTLLALRGTSAEASAAVGPGVAIETLNFNYRIEGDEPPWRPLRAFDDGRQLFIEFPAGLATSEAPPLFVRGDRGQAELVNYRLRGQYYVVDRLPGAAELRLGGRHQQVVRIVRDGRRGRRPS